MHITFSLARTDMIALQHALMGRNSKRHLWLMALLFTLFIGKLASSKPILPLWGARDQAITAILFWVLLVSIIPLSNTLSWRRVLQTRNFNRQTNVELSENGATIRDGTGEIRLTWVELNSVREQSKHIIFRYANTDGIAIPKRVFSTPTEAEEFMRFAESHWQLAHPSPQAIPLAMP